MRLSWNEVRARAATFSHKWAAAGYEKGETQSFYNDFFRVFGVQRRSVARYAQQVRQLDDRSGFIDLFWPGVLIVEQKSAGRDLSNASGQAGKYFDTLPEHRRPRFILVCDFQSFQLHDLDAREVTRFPLAALAENVEALGFILGVQRRRFRDQDPANLKAAELVGRLHDALGAAGYGSQDIEGFLMRTVFCLFADDTGIFERRDMFLEFIETRIREDGSDLGPGIALLFQVLDTPEAQRVTTLDEDVARFPYVGGDLFRGPVRIPSFTAEMRERLLDACRFDWSNISPAIFGALFQSVMDRTARRARGAHYTTEQNILKVLGPLCLDDLKARLARLLARNDSRRRSALRAFQRGLGQLTFFDPACGCGNFLIIAYRELRLLEIEVLRALRPPAGVASQEVLDVAHMSRVNVDQFYGIEIGAFPARIAETALWMMDHIMNNRLSAEFGQNYAWIPLEVSPRIVQADALELDWSEVLPPERCSYLVGNPPFGGFVMRDARKQRTTRAVMAALGAGGARLDYVAAWFLKAGEYARGREARIAFVATNSITQGEQVAQLWPALFGRYGLEIEFAHRTFAWGSDARGAAHVHVVVIGLRDRPSVSPKKRLFLYEGSSGDSTEIGLKRISPYLTDASRLGNPHLVVERRASSIAGFPAMRVGSKPVDGGIYIMGRRERAEILAAEPLAAPLVRPFIGGFEFINGVERWILFASGAEPDTLRSMPHVMKRIRAVREYRSQRAGNLAKSLSERPTDFHVTVVPTRKFLVIPEVCSERRKYVPIGYLKPPTIPSNQLLVIENAPLHLFALLTSRMHMAWLRHVGGRLKSDFRYSSGLVYNTFPAPRSGARLSSLEPLAKRILDVRAAYPEATLAGLYEPDLTPSDLRRAHERLDRAVDRLYRKKRFATARERVEHLFSVYERTQAQMEASA